MRVLLLMAAAFFAPALSAQNTPDMAGLRQSARAAYLKGDYPAARRELEQAWEAAQQTPSNDPDRYAILKQLAGVLSAMGDYAGAQTYIELAIAWREAIDRNDPKLPEEWTELATLCQRQKDFDRAQALLQRSLSVHMKDNALLLEADDFSRMGLVYMDQQDPKAAASVLQSAISLRERALGAEHPAILPELDRLGAIRIALRDYENAETVFRRALVIRERLAGPNDAGLISTVEGLAYAQFGQKKYEDAERGYRRLLQLWLTSTNDPAHPMLAIAYDKLAVFYRAQERWEEARAAADSAVAIRELFLANGLADEASALLARGDKAGAARLFNRALAALDPSRPEQDQLRAQIEKAAGGLSRPKPKKPAPKAPR